MFMRIDTETCNNPEVAGNNNTNILQKVKHAAQMKQATSNSSNSPWSDVMPRLNMHLQLTLFVKRK